MFETLEWVIEEGWPILLKWKENSKRTLEVSESNNSKNIVDYNLFGLFDQQVFLAKSIYPPTKKTTLTTPIVTPTMFVPPIMALSTINASTCPITQIPW